MINKYLFNLSKKKIYNIFIETMGYIPYSINKKSYIKDAKSFTKAINFLLKKEKLYQKLDPSIDMTIIFLLVKTRTAILIKNLNLAKEHLKKLERAFNFINEVSGELRNILIYTKQMISLEIEVLEWCDTTESKLQPIKKAILDNKKKIFEIVSQYKNIELNSPEHLKLSYQQLDLTVENVLLTSSIENYLDKDTKEDGQLLLHRLKVLKNRLIDNNLIQLQNEKVKLGVSNLYYYMLYFRIEAETTKVKFYLGENQKELFNDVYEMIKMQDLFGNTDPISIYKNIMIEEIFNVSPYKQHSNFISYINSFVIEIKKQDNQSKEILLRQMENFQSENINDRLILK